HGCHQDARGRQKWQVALQLTVNHRWEGTELIEHSEEGFKLAVNGKEGIGQRHAAYHGAKYVAFVPLLSGQIRHHREVAAQDYLQAADALTGASIHLVRHRGRTHLAFLEALGHGLIT